MPTPMFPLQTVLLPGSLLPLHVFEPRYLPMIDAVADGDGQLGVVLISRGSEVGGGDVRCDVATMGQVTRTHKLADGRRFVLVVGARRIRVRNWLPDDPHPRAETQDWPDEPEDAHRVADGDADTVRELGALVSDARRLAVRLRSASDPALVPGSAADVDLGDDPSQASYRAAALAPLGPLDRYEVLRTPGASERLAVTRRLVSEAVELLRARIGLDGR